MKRWKIFLAMILLAVSLSGCNDQERNELREKVLRYLRMIHPASPAQVVE